MKRLIALIAAFFVILMIVCCMLAGCEDEPSKTVSCFKSVDYCMTYGISFTVVYQTETKVMYAVSENGALTLLINPDGSPMIYHGE